MYICAVFEMWCSQNNINKSMINISLTYIREYLSGRITALNSGEGWGVELDAISKDVQPAGHDILITLIHIEEERNTKPQGLNYHYYKDESGNTTRITNQTPEIILNLYILISSQNEQYTTALRQISQVIGIFQKKNTFDKKEMQKEGIENIELLSLDLHPLTFEQNNSLWQTLGAKVMPSVVYKVRAIVVQESEEKDSDIVKDAKIQMFIKKEKKMLNEKEKKMLNEKESKRLTKDGEKIWNKEGDEMWITKGEKIWIKEKEKIGEKDINKK